MKKFLGLFLLFSVLSLFLLAGSAMAYIFTYGDNFANWPTTPTGTITSDTHGTPEISGAVVETTGTEAAPGFLKSITINLTDRRVWDALFINTADFSITGWEDWDLIIYESDNGTGGANPYSFDQMPVATDGIYSVSSGYSYEHVNYSAGRQGHVNGITDDQYLGDSSIWYSASWVSNQLKYTFQDGTHTSTIALGSDFGIGYTPWCANDVFLTPISEPSTMLLLGAGLIGLAGLGRRRFFKK